MPNDYLLSDDGTTLTFFRPWKRRKAAMIGAVVIILSVIIGIGLGVISGHSKTVDWKALLITMPLIALVIAPFLWLALRVASPFELRFDLSQGTYEIMEGCYPRMRTQSGTRDDIASVSVTGAYENSFGCVAYQVLLNWKPRRSKRGPSQLDWTADREQAEQEAWNYAQKLGVPFGETKMLARTWD